MNNEAANKIKEIEDTINVHATHFGKNSIKSNRKVLYTKTVLKKPSQLFISYAKT